MRFISVEPETNIIKGMATHPFNLNGNQSLQLKKDLASEMLGGKYTVFNGELRVAMICNWNAECGISTYSKYLADSLGNKVTLGIFSEENGSLGEGNVFYCWKRGESLSHLVKKVKSWKPNIILIQHEFGLFPKAGHFLKLLSAIDGVPYAVILHSVYEHLDKTICTSAIKNIIVHTHEAKRVLRKLGNTSNIYVIPHGCVQFNDTSELWNIFQNDMTMIQFGFGFNYKGVDRCIEAVHHLKKTDPKFKNILYCYLCSENEQNKNTHNSYIDHINKMIDDLGVSENVVIIRKYQDDKAINNYLRTAKLAVFSYKTDPHNTVYGASGAIRIAMANGIPVVASKSHLFDDMDGIIPRPDNALELANEIDKIFSDEKYRNHIKSKCQQYVEENNWSVTATRYMKVMLLLMCRK